MITWAPLSPQRSRNCASPCTTGKIWMPMPPTLASHLFNGTGAIWVTSSRNNPSGGSKRPPGVSWAISTASYLISLTRVANSGASGDCS